MQTTNQHLCFDPILFRKTLHQHPELSNCEANTAAAILHQLELFGVKAISGIGGHGIVAVFDSGSDGQTTLLRADLDAIAVEEKATHDYISQNSGVMHGCGHDGHTTSLLMVAQRLAKHPPKTGKVILLFQPAEETGTGAKAMLEDKWLQKQNVDNLFAYHNLPGYPLGTLVIKPETFACASTGALIEFVGKTSHAAKPENGLSPLKPMLEAIDYLQNLPNQFDQAFSLVTIVYTKLGEEAFGVAPGTGKIMATMRSDCNQTFKQMRDSLKQKLDILANESGVNITLDWDEPFQAAVNSTLHCEYVIEQAKQLGLEVNIIDEPMRWSEDFAEFLQQWPGVLFCLGAGESHPELHNPDYDFPDPLLETASSLLLSIVDRVHGA